MSTATNTPAKTEARKDAMEFTPFGAVDKIKLSIDIVKRFVAVPTKSGVQCDDREAMRFMMLCQAQRLNPFVNDCDLVGYDTKNGPKFNMITRQQVFLKRAESHEDYEGMESGVILLVDGKTTERQGDFALSDERVVGGWCKVYRKGKRPMYKALATEQRKPEYPTQFWEGAKANEQIVKCAEADCLRASFPNLMSGLRVEGETVNVEAVVLPNDAASRETAALAKVLPEQSIKEVVKSTEPTPQQQVEAFIVAERFTYDDLVKVGADTGIFPDGDTFSGFSEIPSGTCKRLLRAKAGLISSLKALQKPATT